MDKIEEYTQLLKEKRVADFVMSILHDIESTNRLWKNENYARMEIQRLLSDLKDIDNAPFDTEGVENEQPPF